MVFSPPTSDVTSTSLLVLPVCSIKRFNPPVHAPKSISFSFVINITVLLVVSRFGE